VLAVSKLARRDGGFTLIELLITIAIVVIAMAIGIPSFVTFQRNAELTSAANSVIAAINAARGEAMKRNRNAYVVPAGTGWGSGFTVFVDSNGSGVAYEDGPDLLVTKQALNLPGYLTVTGVGATAIAGTPYLRFNGSGYMTDTGTAPVNGAITIKRNDVSAADTPKSTRNIMIARTGRVRVCTPSSTSDTNCTTSTLD
jgi:type IV fimbrial biogenesis protein FimT